MSRYLTALFALFITTLSLAHEARPLYIELSEQTQNLISLQWKMPAVAESASAPSVILKSNDPALACEDISSNKSNTPQFQNHKLYRCPQGLDKHFIELNYPSYNPAVSSLLKVSRLNSQVNTVLNGPQVRHINVPNGENIINTMTSYFIQGIKHLLLGYDHLLFLVCLLFLIAGFKRLIWSVTGFTIGHSISLALSALGTVSVPIGPTEVIIAMSICFLAYEAIKQQHTLSIRYPIFICFSFGLLHGLGFASVLTELGLPETQKITALVSFNIGIEVAQIFFIFLLGLILYLPYIRNQDSFETVCKKTPLRAILLTFSGGISLYWSITRLIGLMPI